MLSCASGPAPAIPEEYRALTEALFPPPGQGKRPSVQAARDFAVILGIGADYQQCLDDHAGKALGELLGRFQNNLDLLIQKTWVSKADEIRKEKLQDRVPALIGEIEAEDYAKALEEFGGILEELAYLFFGAQSHKADFTEYTFRIDTQMGLFWWYGGCLSSPLLKNLDGPEDREILKAILLLGISYLTNF